MLRIFIISFIISGCSSKIDSSSKRNIFQKREDLEFKSIKDILDYSLSILIEKHLKHSNEELILEEEIAKVKLINSNLNRLIKERVKNGEMYPYFNYAISILGQDIDSYFLLFFFEDPELVNIVIKSLNEEDINNFFSLSIQRMNLDRNIQIREYLVYAIKLCLEKGIKSELIDILFNIIDYDEPKLIDILFSKYRLDIDLIEKSEAGASYSLLQICIKRNLIETIKFLINKGAKVEIEGTTSTIKILESLENIEVFKILVNEKSSLTYILENKKGLLSSLQKKIKVFFKLIENLKDENSKESFKEKIKNLEEIIRLVKEQIIEQNSLN